MALVEATTAEREELAWLAKHARDGRVLRRAQGLLWLADGIRPSEVAQQLGASRDTVYQWAQRWHERRRQTGAAVLADRPRSGRPRQKRAAVAQVVGQVLGTDPKAHGYRASGWTAGLVAAHLQRKQGLRVHESTVRRCLRELGYRWKRPRYVLARRARHWRQAKGGSSAG